jgi:heme exporter protein D
MSVLVWLAIPVVAVVLAILWVMWATRTRPPVDVHDSLEEHERFKAAFDRRSGDPSKDRVPDRRRGNERRTNRRGS